MSELVTLFLFSGFTEILLVLVIQMVLLLVTWSSFFWTTIHYCFCPCELLSTNGHIGSFASWQKWTAGYTPYGYGLAGTKRFVCVYAVANGSNAIQHQHHAALSKFKFNLEYELYNFRRIIRIE